MQTAIEWVDASRDHIAYIFAAAPGASNQVGRVAEARLVQRKFVLVIQDDLAGCGAPDHIQIQVYEAQRAVVPGGWCGNIDIMGSGTPLGVPVDMQVIEAIGPIELECMVSCDERATIA